MRTTDTLTRALGRLDFVFALVRWHYPDLSGFPGYRLSGARVSSNVLIRANAVATHDTPPSSIVGGALSRVLRKKPQYFGRRY